MSVVLASALVIALAAAWGTLAIGYRAPGGGLLRGVLAGSWALFAIAVLVVLVRHHAAPALAVFAAAFVLLLLWWRGIEPSNRRIWADDVAQTLRGHVDGERVRLEGVRNFQWHTREDYTPRWESREYDLSRLASVDMFLSSWGRPSIAHMILSFGFGDGGHVAFSVEIRREKHEAFSEIAGFFKQFELSIIAADERDIVRVRSNLRGEEVTVYRLRLAAPQQRALFLAYVAEANRLAATPRFYNTITANCTTLVYRLARPVVGRLPLDRRLLQTGYLPAYLEGLGGLQAGIPLATLAERGRIGARARAADADADFSAAIRVGVPGVAAPAAADR